MKVFLLGHRGMLGQTIARFFGEKGVAVHTSERRYLGGSTDPLTLEARDSGCEWVINALGRIWQKNNDPAELVRANTLFPLELAARLTSKQRLLHASTDGVFSGQRGAYRVDENPDASDPYGMSKAMAEHVLERDGTVIIRCSFVGPQAPPAPSLMGWFLGQTSQVSGYTDHLWNGLTTLEWARIAHGIITGKLKIEDSLLQPGFWPAISKYELLRAIGKAWGHAIPIVPREAGRVDRSLVPNYPVAEISRQLSELRAWFTSPGSKSSRPAA